MQKTRIGFGGRLLAVILDGILLTILSWIVFWLFSLIGMGAGSFLGSAMASNQSQAPVTGIMGGIFGLLGGGLIGTVLLIIAYLALEAFTGYTLGKWLMGIRVGTQTGEIAPTPIYLQRFLLKNSFVVLSILGILVIFTHLISLALFLIYAGWGLGAIVAIGYSLALGGQRQALHDLVTKTAVYRSRDLVSQPINH